MTEDNTSSDDDSSDDDQYTDLKTLAAQVDLPNDFWQVNLWYEMICTVWTVNDVLSRSTVQGRRKVWKSGGASSTGWG